jgi:hypothetical protein
MEDSIPDKTGILRKTRLLVLPAGNSPRSENTDASQSRMASAAPVEG